MDISDSRLPPGMLLKAIQNEQDKIAYFECLNGMTEDPENNRLIQSVIAGEQEHLLIFTDLYIRMFQEQPDINCDILPQILTFIEGIKQSIVTELYAYDFYNNIYSYEQNEQVRGIFHQAMTDETNHAVKFNFIYEKLVENLP